MCVQIKQMEHFLDIIVGNLQDFLKLIFVKINLAGVFPQGELT